MLFISHNVNTIGFASKIEVRCEGAFILASINLAKAQIDRDEGKISSAELTDLEEFHKNFDKNNNCNFINPRSRLTATRIMDKIRN